MNPMTGGEPAWGGREVAMAIGLMAPALLFGSIVAAAGAWAILGRGPTGVEIAIAPRRVGGSPTIQRW